MTENLMLINQYLRNSKLILFKSITKKFLKSSQLK